MSAWITDREPTIQDTDKCGKLWVSYGTGTDMIHFTNYRVGQPWQPITYPEPYQKPKVWVVNGSGVFKNGVRLSADDITKREWTIIEDALNRLEDSHD